MKNSFFTQYHLVLGGLGLLLVGAAPRAALAQAILTNNGGTLFVNTGGTLQVNGNYAQTSGSLLRTTGAARVAGAVQAAAGSTLDLSTGELQATGNVSNAGTAAGTTGTLRLTGTAAQALGMNAGILPNLSVDKPSGTATLSQAVQVRRVLTMAGAGNLDLAGNGLTLLSDATGTALVVNQGAGVVSGAATVQRYIDPSVNNGLGYRHYAAPVTNTTVADLTTAGFTPVVNDAYNTSPTPGQVPSFPTVFGYDQARLASVNNNLSPFDKGWFSPQALTDALTPGRGYTVDISANQLVDFVGTLGTGDRTMNLARNAGATAADAGWALLGNPYPAPLDYSKVLAADRPNLDAAVYVVQSTGQYAGAYRAYVNGQSTTGTNNPLIASGQGFFVRVSQGQTSGSLTFRNGQRETDYTAAQGALFQRGTPDTRPAVRLTLAGAGKADGWVAYAEAGATPAFNREFDATKLPNSTGLNLSSVAGAERLAIDGQAAFTTATVLPLAVGVPAAGTYTLSAAALDNLPAGLTAYLRDAQTGQTLTLTAGTSYSFTATAAQAQALILNRFTVQFAPNAPLSATSAALAAVVSVYPNPARERVSVSVPGLRGSSQVQVELCNALGQVVLRQQAALPASGTTLTLTTAGMATGVYLVRLSAGELRVAKRLVIE